MYQSTYLADAFNCHSAYVERSLRALEYIEFEAIAYRGVSGSLIAPTVAHLMGKSLLVVRKKDGSHSSLPVEGHIGAKTYIIVDDFCDSGNTIREIISQINSLGWGAKCVGIYLYLDRKTWLGGYYGVLDVGAPRIIGPLDFFDDDAKPCPPPPHTAKIEETVATVPFPAKKQYCPKRRREIKSDAQIHWIPANKFHFKSVRDDLAELKQSIAQIGFKEPVLATRTNSGFKVIDGARRVEIGRQLGIPIPTRIATVKTDEPWPKFHIETCPVPAYTPPNDFFHN